MDQSESEKPFHNARLKLQWANRNAQSLNDSIKAYWQNNANCIFIEPNPEVHEKEARVRLNPFPNWWPLLIGDIIHNLRSALDHLATDAAKLNGQTSKTALSETYFPICASEDALLHGDGAKKIRRLSKAHRDTIASFKPYKGGNPTLYALHQLDIRDKHLMIVPAAGALMSNETELRLYQTPDGTFAGAVEMRVGATTAFPLKDGDILATFPADQPEENIQPKATVQIAFGEGQPYEGKSVMETLDDMGTEVSRIIQALTLAV